jgi:hypothetical protein
MRASRRANETTSASLEIAMKRSPILLLCLPMLTSCGATVKIEGAGGSSDDGNAAGGFGNGSTDDDGGFSDGSGGFSVGDGGSSTGPWTPDCYDESSALYLPPDVVLGVDVDQGACSETQVGELFTACIGDMASQQSCEAFIGAAAENQACFDCTFGSEPGPFPMPVVVMGTVSPYLSIYACIAHVAGMPDCEVPVQSIVFCAFTACDQCELGSEEGNECVNWALNESPVCTTIELPAGCEMLFGVEQVPAECIGDAMTLEEAFPILADFYCGAP